MIIIVEGPDFSGKTTLIQQLVEDLGAAMIKVGRPQSMTDVYDWDALVTSHPSPFVVCDRSPLISEPIYGPIIRNENIIPNDKRALLLESLFEEGAIVVFCDPGLAQVRSMNNEQMEGVRKNIDKIYEVYQVSMARMPGSVISYDFNRPGAYDSLLKFLCNLNDHKSHRCFIEDDETLSVQDFNERFDIPMPASPTLMEPDVFGYRHKFLREELLEFIEAHDQGNLVKAFDALLDLVYVAKGTALLMGITPEMWLHGFDEVQKANMSKVRAPSAAHSKRGHALDVIKPDGWIGPEAELKRILDW